MRCGQAQTLPSKTWIEEVPLQQVEVDDHVRAAGLLGDVVQAGGVGPVLGVYPHRVPLAAVCLLECGDVHWIAARVIREPRRECVPVLLDAGGNRRDPLERFPLAERERAEALVIVDRPLLGAGLRRCCEHRLDLCVDLVRGLIRVDPCSVQPAGVVRRQARDVDARRGAHDTSSSSASERSDPYQ
jgi:hypothetical protein